MAFASAELLSFLFLASLLFSQQAQARESQFFSKFTNFNNEKETVTPVNKKQEQEQEQEPAFVPQTQGGYGLYGHEAGQFPPATTTTTTTNGAPYTTTATTNKGAPYTTTTNNGAPYTTTTSTNNNLPYTLEAIEKEEQHTDKYPETYHTRYNPNKDNYYYNGNNPSGISDTKLSAQSTFTPTKYQNTNNNNNNNYNNVERQGMSDTRYLENGRFHYDVGSENNYNNNNNNYNHVERQGMSDTRYLENGRFHYDVGSENNYNNNKNQYGNYREAANDPKNWYNNRGNYGNNNNVNHHNNYNSMEGYQNEEEFQETDDEFVP